MDEWYKDTFDSFRNLLSKEADKTDIQKMIQYAGQHQRRVIDSVHVPSFLKVEDKHKINARYLIAEFRRKIIAQYNYLRNYYGLDKVEEKLFVEKQNLEFERFNVQYEVSRTPGEVNMQHFTYKEYNKKIVEKKAAEVTYDDTIQTIETSIIEDDQILTKD